MGNVDQRIAELASRHHGAVRHDQLRAAGISDGAIARRLEDGTLTRWSGLVYHPSALGNPPPDATRLHAAVLAAAPGAALSHDTAVAFHGGWTRWTGRLHVTSHTHAGAVGRDDLVIHRCSRPLAPETTCRIDGIPVLAAPHACAQLGTELGELQITNVIAQLHFLGLIDPATFDALLDELGRPRGVAVVRRACARYLAGSMGTRSRSEDRLHDALARAGIAPVHVNVRGAVLPGIELDFAWPRPRLVVEVDGRQHRFDRAAASDRDVDALAGEAGWKVLRVPTSRIWRDVRACVAEIADQLAHRNPSRRRN